MLLLVLLLLPQELPPCGPEWRRSGVPSGWLTPRRSRSLRVLLPPLLLQLLLLLVLPVLLLEPQLPTRCTPMLGSRDSAPSNELPARTKPESVSARVRIG